MSWTESDKPKTRAELRKFGLVVGTAFLLLAAVVWWKHGRSFPYLAGIGAVLLLTAFSLPQALAPVEKYWMRFATVMGTVMTFVLMTIMFVAVITPVGLARRLFAGDTFGKHPNRNMKTYWVPVRPDGPASRPDKPF